jgi:nitroreductase
MDTFSAIEARRSVKHFDPIHVMQESEIRKIIEAGMLAPTAFNIQHWRFVIVQDKSLRQQIRELSWNQAQVTDASLLIILCADKMAWAKNPERYWQNAPQAVQDFLVPAIGQYYTGNDAAQQDEAMRSCGMTAQNIMLAAKSMGYDSCPMDGFDFKKVAEVINLPHDQVISMFITIGKATKDANVRGGQLSYEEVVIRDKF